MEFQHASPPPSSLSLPRNEVEILEYWENTSFFEKNAFLESLERNKELPLYTFYDGPPFASGNPHHGHVLAGTIKDVVTRYFHQNGFNIPRRFGWDCHGVPVENEINKLHKIERREDVLGHEGRGVRWYNDECRKIVMRCVDRWKSTTRRLGRWIDFENDYKTLNMDFMESVWSVFHRLFELGLVYRGERVMPVSTALGTPMSKHEVGPETYKDASDISVFVSFQSQDADEEYVAWTTTPWTLVSNIGLCVNPHLEYIRLRSNGRVFVMLKSRVSQVFDEFEQIGDSFLGSTLKGKRYRPLFDLFANDKYFQLVCDEYVTSESGTGIVHLAPGFGEDDHRVCMVNGLIKEGSGLPCPVDDEGRFTRELVDYNPTHVLANQLLGKHVKTKEEGNANALICAELKQAQRLLKMGSIVHKVPFCSRSKTPLIYKAVKSWFIRVDTGEIETPTGKRSLRDVMVENNAQIRWVPEFVGKGRFHEWLKQSRDWNVSRNRFWGTPIPIWESEDGKERVCISSVTQLEELTGQRFTDIHRENVDDVEFRLRPDGPVLRRVPELFDCWFESGSMPYATSHYMFDSPNKPPPSTFPAEFIAEGLDQTRGWFYTLMVLSTAIFQVPPFKNVIVNGMVLAEDGKKMSKSLRNYPPPEEVIARHGADALRLYLINSPVVKAEPLRFSEDGVSGVVRDVFLPWLNALRFFIQNVKRVGTAFSSVDSPAKAKESSNTMDMWILAEMRDLIRSVRTEMEAYRLFNVLPRLLVFIDSLTNWYVRLNRERLKDDVLALSVLFEILLNLSRLMAPVAPFFAEYCYQQLCPVGSPRREGNSIHFLRIPDLQQEEAMDVALLRKFRALQTAVQLGRNARGNIKTKTPIVELILVSDSAELRKDLLELEPYLLQELNAFKLKVPENADAWGKVQLVFNEALMGKKFKKDKAQIVQAVLALPSIPAFLEQLEKGPVEVVAGKPSLEAGDVSITRVFAGNKDQYSMESNFDLMVVVDKTSNELVLDMTILREFKSQVQKLRKKLGLSPDDAIFVHVLVKGKEALRIEQLLKDQSDLLPFVGLPPKLAVRAGQVMDMEFLDGHQWDIIVCRPYVQVLNSSLPPSVHDVLFYLGCERLRTGSETLKFKVDNEVYDLKRGVDYKV